MATSFPRKYAALTLLERYCTVILYKSLNPPNEGLKTDFRKNELFMAIHTTYSNARANFALLLDQVTDQQEIVIINRRGSDDVALVAVSELSSLLETAHLLRSPKNAQRLMTALKRAMGKKLKPQRMESLREEIGFERKE